MSTSTSGMNNDLQRLALEQDALLVEARRRLAVRTGLTTSAASPSARPSDIGSKSEFYWNRSTQEKWL